MAPRTKMPPLSILSLDGGELGPWNYSQIFILRHMLNQYKFRDAQGDQEWDGDGRLSDYFNVIGGTGFGGVIAMLATKISINKIANFYVKLHEALFTKPEWKERNLEANAAAVHMLVEEFLPEVGLDEPILGSTSVDKGACYTFTCAVNSVNTAHPRLFTSYQPKFLPTPCTLRQAIELSLADEVHLPSFKLGNPSEQFIGNSHRFNPLFLALKEVEALFTPSQPVNCIVSVGAGHKGVLGIGVSHCIIADGEREAHYWGTRFSTIVGLFHRLNVKDGLEGVNDLGCIATQATAYIAKSNTIDTLLHCETAARVQIGQLLLLVKDHDKVNMRTTNPTIPPPPPHLFGREEDMSSIITCLLQYMPVVLCGSLGLGKTSLALAVLYDAKLQHLTRYFIDCRDAKTLNFLYVQFARSLGIEVENHTHAQSLWAIILNELQSVEGVVYLDSLETLWDQDALRDDIEKMLASLANLAHISLLVTMRVAKPPRNVTWAISHPLPPLCHEDAFQLFKTYSKCADDDEYAHKLVESADGVPQVVELLADLADGAVETTHEVWYRWVKKGTSIAKRGRGPRFNLNYSIELSLDSSQLKKFPTAHSTLYLLSLLPVGLDPRSRFFTVLREGIPDLLANLRCLIHQALVIVDNPTTRRCLLVSPIARYVADNLSSSLPPHDRTYLIQSSIDFITSHDPSTPENHLFVPSELSNLYSVLKHASAVYMDDILAKGIIGYAHWAHHSQMLGDNMLDSVLNSPQCSIPLLAEASQLQGKIYIRQGHLNEAEESLVTSLSLYQRVEHVLGEGDARKLLGDLYIQQGRLNEAEESLHKSIILFQQAKSVPGERAAHHSLGHLYMRQNRLNDAEESLVKSLFLYQQAEHALGEGASRQSLGQLYMRQNRLNEAEESLVKSLVLYQQAEHVLGEGDARKLLGDLYMQQGRLNEAEESLHKSIILFQQAKSVPGEGNSHRSLGDLYILQDRLNEAEESLHKSIILYQQEKSVLGEGASRQSLGHLYMRQNRLNDAAESLVKSLFLYQQAEHALGEGASRQSLGQLYMRQNCLNEAEESLVTSLSLYQRAEHVLGEGDARKLLGDLYIQQGRLNEAEESLYKSLILFQQAKSVSGEGNSHRSLGDLYILQDRLHEAEESLHTSIILYQQAKSVLGEGASRQSLGHLYMRQNRLDEAEESLVKSLVLYQDIQDVYGEGDSRQSLGELYLRQNQPIKAKASLHHSIHLYQQCQPCYSEAYSHKWLGQVHEYLHEFDEAEMQYGIAIDLHRQRSDTSARAQETTLFLEQLRSTRYRIPEYRSEVIHSSPPVGMQSKPSPPGPHSIASKLSAATPIRSKIKSVL